MDKLVLTPEDDDARAECFKSFGAMYYQRVGDYSDTLTEECERRRIICKMSWRERKKRRMSEEENNARIIQLYRSGFWD